MSPHIHIGSEMKVNVVQSWIMRSDVLSAVQTDEEENNYGDPHLLGSVN